MRGGRTLATRIELEEVARILGRMGIQRRELYFWSWNASVTSRNTMVLPARLKVYNNRPARLERLRKDSRIAEGYRYGGYLFARMRQHRIPALSDYMCALLQEVSPGTAYVLTEAACNGLSEAEPWLTRADRGSRYARTLRAYGIREGMQCAIRCELGSDTRFILSLANDTWTRVYWRNLYVFIPPDVKLVICHERDIHVCIRRMDHRHGLLTQALTLASRHELSVLPFDKQFCS